MVAPRFYVSYVGKTFFNEANALGQDGYALANAYFDWKLLKRLSVTLAAENIGDKLYLVYSSGTTQNQPGTGRSVSAGLRVEF